MTHTMHPGHERRQPRQHNTKPRQEGSSKKAHTAYPTQKSQETVAHTEHPAQAVKDEGAHPSQERGVTRTQATNTIPARRRGFSVALPAGCVLCVPDPVSPGFGVCGASPAPVPPGCMCHLTPRFFAGVWQCRRHLTKKERQRDTHRTPQAREEGNRDTHHTTQPGEAGPTGTRTHPKRGGRGPGGVRHTQDKRGGNRRHTPHTTQGEAGTGGTLPPPKKQAKNASEGHVAWGVRKQEEHKRGCVGPTPRSQTEMRTRSGTPGAKSPKEKQQGGAKQGGRRLKASEDCGTDVPGPTIKQWDREQEAQ